MDSPRREGLGIENLSRACIRQGELTEKLYICIYLCYCTFILCFRYVRVCHTKDKLWGLPPGPKVVLASVPSLATGMSAQLLVDWGPNPNNLIIFPGQAAVRSGSSMYDMAFKGRCV